MRHAQEGSSKWWEHWLSQPGNAELVDKVRERIRTEGPLRGADFEHHGPRRGAWWDWKPAKHALERLFDRGELMIADRVNFQRVYDLRERVLPKWVDAREPAPDEMHRHMLEWATRALGICQPLQAADYVWSMKRGIAKPYLAQLIGEGQLIPIQAELADGQVHELVIQRDHLADLERAADGALAPQRTTFLSPFDNLFWARGRDRQLWFFTRRWKPTGLSRNAPGATSACPSCTRTGWSDGSTRSWSGRRAGCASRRCISSAA